MDREKAKKAVSERCDRMNNLQILLDMDGVLVNFVKAASAAHGRPYEPEKITQFSMAELWGLSVPEFWKPLVGQQFWADMEPYPWASELLAALREIAPVTICTAPSIDYHCCGAKREWLHQHFGIKSSDVVLANKKWLLAAPNHLLIDDSDRKVKQFKNAGGRAIIFPQPWNECAELSGAHAWRLVVEQAKVFGGAA